MDERPHWTNEKKDPVTVICADSLEHLRTMDADSIDVVITDPPYGLSATDPSKVNEAIGAWVSGDREHMPKGRGFMGADWDAFVPPPALWDECLRVLKPGGHLAAFAGSRTYDLMGLSIRLAGFEIRDGLSWIYGSGMPHGQNMGKSVEAQITRGASSSRRLKDVEQSGGGVEYEITHRINGKMSQRQTVAHRREYSPGVAEAEQWQGWSTSLKPAQEPIVLARKPLAETSVARNVLAHGTGAIHVDACRVEHRTEADRAESVGKNRHADYGSRPGRNHIYGDFTSGEAQNYDGSQGRYPTNVLLSHSPGCELDGMKSVKSDSHHPASRPAGGIGKTGHGGQSGLTERSLGSESVENWVCAPGCPVAEVDAQSGVSKSSGGNGVGYGRSGGVYGAGGRQGKSSNAGGVGDVGGASRFFPTSQVPFVYSAKAGAKERPVITRDDGTEIRHVSVKPLAVMRWLVRLLTPPGGTILDPFAGSGTTVEAAMLEDFGVIGIEREADYIELIETRISRHSH